MQLFHERLGGWTSIADTFVSFFGNLPNCFWLDRQNHTDERYTIIGSGQPANVLDPLDYYSDLELPFSFRPGFVGVVHYPQIMGEVQDVTGLSVDRAFVYDHNKRVMHFLGVFQSKSDFDSWYHAALLRLALLGGDAASYELYNPAATAPVMQVQTNRDDYIAKISSAQDFIRSGDVYQLCLTTQLTGEFVGSPLSYFLRLRKQNPAPYSAFVRVEGVEVVSISPERFVTVQGSKVLSSPIKGTRPRGADPQSDQRLLEELGTDAKERAENLMIVDLIRNDLSVVCEPSSVKVDSLLAVRSYSTVHQLVSDISAELAEDKTGLDALKALLPGGSMTGAPKHRAMQILSELEGYQRGLYSGGIGWIAGDWTMDLGMVIRTAVFYRDSVSIGIGGGITIDSVPENEHEEIVLKSNALVRALGAQVNW